MRNLPQGRKPVPKLLDLFFKKSQPASPTTISPPPVRAPRIKILALHNIHFTSPQLPHPSEFTLANLSISGLGCILHDASWPPPGSTVEGFLKIEEIAHPTTLRVIHLNHGIAGASFQNPSIQLIRAISDYLDIELAAVNLKAVPSTNLKEEPDGEPFWFYGTNNCELFFVLKDDKIVRFYLTLFGNYVEGTLDQPLKYGKVQENTQDRIAHKESATILWQPTWDQRLTDLTDRMLLNITKLQPEHREALRRAIAGKPQA